MEQNSLVRVLEAISDTKSLEIFQFIGKYTAESNVLKQKKGISRKQFYGRTKRLINTGLVKRVKGIFSLTNFGMVVYHAVLTIDAGVNSYWKLKAIDSIQESSQILDHERMNLIKTILNDGAIEDILVKRR